MINMTMSIQDFALINGEVVFISDFRHLVNNFRDRPIAYCPVNNCGGEMTMVLPQDESVRRSHFRHISKAISDHSPESIWHAGTKYHIAARLKHGARINLYWQCRSGFCEQKHPVPSRFLREKYNHIDIDHKKIDRFLPDITLYKDSRPLAVIEVFNTHISSDEKIEFYNVHKIPWFELKVQSTEDYKNILAWSDGEGLQHFISRMFYPEDWPEYCPTCALIIEEREKKAALARQTAEKKALAEKNRVEKERKANELKQSYIREQNKFKEEVGKKIYNYLHAKQRIDLQLNFECRNCHQEVSQYFSPYAINSYETNWSVSKFNTYFKCDIVLLSKNYKPLGFVIVNNTSSAKESYTKKVKQEILSRFSIFPEFIEIELSSDNKSFKVIDSTKHHKRNLAYICEKCVNAKKQKEDIQRKEEEEYHRLEMLALEQQRIPREKWRQRSQDIEFRILETKREVRCQLEIERGKLRREEFISSLQKKRNDVKTEIAFCYESIKVAPNDETKIELRIRLAKLNADLRSYNKILGLE